MCNGYPKYCRDGLNSISAHRRELGRAVLLERDVDERREHGGMFGGIEADQLQSVFEVGEALARGRLGVAENAGVPILSGVFCKSCDDDHSTQVCGVSPRRAWNCLDEAGLADARLADDLEGICSMRFRS